MNINGRLESYENVPCEVLCFPPAIPYYFAYQHYKALDSAKGGEYWAHIAFIASECIPFLNFIPFAIDYFAGKKVNHVSFEVSSPSVTITSPLTKPKVDHRKRKSIDLRNDTTSQLFTGFIFGGMEDQAISYFNDNKEKLLKTINLPFSLGLLCCGNTALHYACYMHMNKLIRLLIEEGGADIEAQNDEEKTPRDCYQFEGADARPLLGDDKNSFFAPRPNLDPNDLINILALLTPKEEV